MIHVHVTYTFRSAADRDAYYEAINRLQIPEMTRCEKGNYMYDYFLPMGTDKAIFLLEKWEDAESIAVHTTQPHFLRMGELKAQYVEKTEIPRFESKAL